jgi:hypothetical protein
MASLPNRILRLLLERPQTMTAATIATFFASYRADYVAQTIARLQRLDLVISDDEGRMTCTRAGRVTAVMTKPARWSAPRFASIRSSPLNRRSPQLDSNQVNTGSDSQPILAPHGA